MQTAVVFFKDKKAYVPLLIWINTMPLEAKAKCLAKLELLQEYGHSLRRPHVDYLRDGIYELRIRYFSVQYRILYFFNKEVGIVISHGIKKEAKVPAQEIDLAVSRKSLVQSNKNLHIYQEIGYEKKSK